MLNQKLQALTSCTGIKRVTGTVCRLFKLAIIISLIISMILACVIRPRGYKTFFVLNSVEHEILNAHKYKNIKKFGLFKAQLSLECYFSSLIHVKMPTIVGILTFMSGENFMLN